MDPDVDQQRGRGVLARVPSSVKWIAGALIAALALLGGYVLAFHHGNSAVPAPAVAANTKASTTTSPPTTTTLAPTTTSLPPTTTTVPPKQAVLAPRTATTTPPPPPAPPAPAGPHTSEHYTANVNFSGSTYVPGADGFNLADVSSNSVTAALPAGVKGLEYIGSCDGATASFQSTIASFIGDPTVFGFYLMDEPNPSSCSAANLKAESDWIHANDPGTYTFIIEEDLSSSNHPTYQGGYNPANSDIDLYGLDPYPCRSENPASAPCAYSWLGLAVTAAESAGIPLADIVPVYQAFGGGAWVDDGGGSYQLPTAAEESAILATWGFARSHPGLRLRLFLGFTKR